MTDGWFRTLHLVLLAGILWALDPVTFLACLGAGCGFGAAYATGVVICAVLRRLYP